MQQNFHFIKFKGQFPTLMFTLTFSLGTLFFCGLLFHTQRSHVVNKDDDDDGNIVSNNDDQENLINDDE